MKLSFPFSKKQEESKETDVPITLSSPEKRRFENIFSPTRYKNNNSANDRVNETDYQSGLPKEQPKIAKEQSKFGLKAITDFTSNLGKNISEMLDLPEPTTNNNVRRKSGTAGTDQVDIFSSSLLDVMKGIGNDISKEAMKIIPTSKPVVSTDSPTKTASAAGDSKLKSPSGRPRHASELLEMESIYAFDEADEQLSFGDRPHSHSSDEVETDSFSAAPVDKPVKPAKPVKATPQKGFAAAAEQLNHLLDQDEDANTSSFAIQSASLSPGSPATPVVALHTSERSPGAVGSEQLDLLRSEEGADELEEEYEEAEVVEEQQEKDLFALPNDGFDDDDEFCV